MMRRCLHCQQPTIDDYSERCKKCEERYVRTNKEVQKRLKERSNEHQKT